MLIFGTIAHPTGTFSTFIDLYFNIKKLFPDVKIKLFPKINKNSFKMMIYKNVGNYTDILCSNTNESLITDQTIITSTKVFHDILINNCNVSIKCKNLILLDTWDIYRTTLNNTTDDLISLIKSSAENIFFLGNSFNLNLCNFKNKFLYFHKLSEERLSSLIPQKNNSLIFYRDDSVVVDTFLKYFSTSNKKITYKELFQCSEYHYTRWDHKNNIYFENIGKMIFEFLWMNKKVKYFSNNKSINDGLTEYLKLFNIDDNITQYLNISKNDIEKKLFMHKNDTLLNILRNI